MTLDTQTLLVILVMTIAAAFCRYSGFAFMRLVPMTPRVRAGLDAIPIAVMLGIILPPAVRGGIPELVGLAGTVIAAHLRGNDVLAIIVGMGSVAAMRWLGY